MVDTHQKIEAARQNLRIAMAMRHMNASECSRAAGMSRNGLGQFIAGRTVLSYQNMLSVCDVLGLPIGIVHQADGVSEMRIRLYRALERLPDHLAAEALAIVQAETPGRP